MDQGSCQNLTFNKGKICHMQGQPRGVTRVHKIETRSGLDNLESAKGAVIFWQKLIV